jgi:peroxiredoxin/uncharacterized membrane protein YphA (DoxX/SURF4 family)
MSALLLFARLVLAAVFVVAGLAKLRDRSGTAASVIAFGVPEVLGRPVAELMPIAEVVCAVALVAVSTAWWGAVAVLVLLLLFTAAISVSLARGRAPDCHCFGQLHAKPVGWTTLVRNGALLGVAVFVVAQGEGNVGASVLDLPHLIASQGVVTGLLIALVAVAAFELVMLFSLLRQNGRLLLRLEAVETKLGSNAGVPQAKGLPVGMEAPVFTLPDLDGNRVALGTLVGRGALLLYFTEPWCSACNAALSEIAKWQREYRGRLELVPIARGDVSTNRTKAATHGLSGVLLQRDRETTDLYLASVTPSAVLVVDGLIASPLAEGIDAIRELVMRATLPPPLKKGDAVPALSLPDLAGTAVNLARLKGRPTLLLFWNPACGFCQQMLPDLKAWEVARPKGSPDLLVISTGSRQVNRQQGFQSTVILDHKLSASQVFGSSGTPSAVMLDEQGRVASDISVGAVSVLALANGTRAPEEVHA